MIYRILMKVVFYEDFMRRNVGCMISFQNQSTGENHLFPDCNNLKVTRHIVVKDRPPTLDRKLKCAYLPIKEQ